MADGDVKARFTLTSANIPFVLVEGGAAGAATHDTPPRMTNDRPPRTTAASSGRPTSATPGTLTRADTGRVS